MGNIGDGTGTGWPATFDTQTTPEVNDPAPNRTLSRAEPVNDLAAICLALEQKLGINPQFNLSTVAAFLAVEHTVDGKHIWMPAGTVMVFYQSAAPTGWTRVTTQNDKALRVVSAGSPGTAGGTTAFSSAWPAQNPTSGNASGDHTHTGSSHTHDASHGHNPGLTRTTAYTDLTTSPTPIVERDDTDQIFNRSTGGSLLAAALTNITPSSSVTTAADGTGASSGQSATHTHTVAVTTAAPQYIDVLLASKN